MACGLNCVWAWLNVAALWLAFSAACGGVAGLAASGILHTRVGFWCRDGTSAWIDCGSAVATQWTSGWIVGAMVGGTRVTRVGIRARQKGFRAEGSIHAWQRRRTRALGSASPHV